jgi:TetR/AcrR family transcriptional repressor of nem operon
MRVSKEQAAANRERILKAAARLMRERGISGIGVDALTEAAGLTHGSLYSQFGSKERLAAEALSHAFARSTAKFEEIDSLADYVALYLSPSHRDTPGRGCTLAALGCEIPRQGGAVRKRYTEGLQRMAGRLAKLLRSRPAYAREDAALAVIATLVGALVLARAVDDPGLSDRILRAARKRLNKGDDH